ncbi:HSPB1-associated protein 1 homolog isoform X2 [Amphibalanus amphitrite]|nr:HSPB1-associated protein 1 homolog isoform X2 [Amphibalanus amphitrite]
MNMQPSVLKEGILYHLDYPVVFSSMVDVWGCSRWSLEEWASFFGDKQLSLRIGKQEENAAGPQWETENVTVSATVRQLLDWAAGRPGKRRLSQDEPSPLASYRPHTHWAYYAYKHIPQEFGDSPYAAAKLGIDWSMFGFPGRGAEQSTLWLGTPGAHTLCHRDTYGLNLVTQLVGRKRWTLFPPSDGPRLYPTRVPYEESTVFSAANLRRPDFNKFPDLVSTRPHIVELTAGETLLVPRHWWHLVENLETSVSINTWIELPCDAEARLQEALVRTMVARLPADAASARLLLNDPLEECWPLDACLSALQQSAAALSLPPAPTPPRDRRAFWATYRAWPGNRRVPACPPTALLRPEVQTAQTASAASSPDPVVSPRLGSPESAASPPAGLGVREVYLALAEAVTDPQTMAAAAEAFKRALRRRGGVQIL